MQNDWKNNIKDTFENREIEATPELWNQLESQLDNHYTRNKNRKQSHYIVLSVAASFLTTIILYNQHFFNQKNPTEGYVIVKNNPESLKRNPAEDFQLKNIQEKISGTDTANVIALKKSYINNNRYIIKEKESSNQNTLKEMPEDEIISDSQKYVDEVLGDFSSDKILLALQEDVLFEQRVDSIFQAMYFTNINPDELLLVASSEAKLNEYIEENLDTEKILSDIEKSDFKYRARLFFDRVNDEYDKLRIAFHQMKKNN
ncbi:hypothetical protein [Capnocytophaga felis]|uniref:Uncharacterized protein n=1 Tax=Capnocytophaga felis TaxID=2267611 RepID=A0A5M4BAI5_9FLAO|nr:hypothetical protein [Capnocytophaga felis]GET46126.1 hypothetical protein RCZ01_14280 [Capnocytophaga felis]GET48918.1 hypothetical protein RCZ02_17490 [Capnocytophaga felis]